MLEDKNFQDIVSWGPGGDCFVVKDMNDFTKSILPRMFKHSNFASFVRQLNKYDFHKVKNPDDSQFGEQSWTFRHPDFHADRRDSLENIKRKVPAVKKQVQAHAAAAAAATAASHNHPNHRHHHHHHHRRPLSPSPSPSVSPHRSHSYTNSYNAPPIATLPPSSIVTTSSGPLTASQIQIDALQSQVRMLLEQHDEMLVRLRTLERNYQDVLVEMVGFQRSMAHQDNIIQSLMQSWLAGDLPPPNVPGLTGVGGAMGGPMSGLELSNLNAFKMVGLGGE